MLLPKSAPPPMYPLKSDLQIPIEDKFNKYQRFTWEHYFVVLRNRYVHLREYLFHSYTRANIIIAEKEVDLFRLECVDFREWSGKEYDIEYKKMKNSDDPHKADRLEDLYRAYLYKRRTIADIGQAIHDLLEAHKWRILEMESLARTTIDAYVRPQKHSLKNKPINRKSLRSRQ